MLLALMGPTKVVGHAASDAKCPSADAGASVVVGEPAMNHEKHLLRCVLDGLGSDTEPTQAAMNEGIVFAKERGERWCGPWLHP